MYRGFRDPALIENICLHTNESDENTTTALSLAHYLEINGDQGGGYHEVVDNKSVVILAKPSTFVYGAGGDNLHGYHICLVGFAHQTAAQWADAYSRGELEKAAQRVAAMCTQLRVLPIKIGPVGLVAHNSGICGHADVGIAFEGNNAHTDPGPDFPWSMFIRRVNAILYPAPAPAPAPVEAADPMMVTFPGGDPYRPWTVKLDTATKTLTMFNGCGVAGDHSTPYGVRMIAVPTGIAAPIGVELYNAGKAVRVVDSLGHGFVYSRSQ